MDQRQEYGTSSGQQMTGEATAQRAALLARAEKAEAEVERLLAQLENAARISDKWATDEQRQHGAGGPAAEIRASLAAREVRP